MPKTFQFRDQTIEFVARPTKYEIFKIKSQELTEVRIFKQDMPSDFPELFPGLYSLEDHIFGVSLDEVILLPIPFFEDLIQEGTDNQEKRVQEEMKEFLDLGLEIDSYLD